MAALEAFAAGGGASLSPRFSCGLVVGKFAPLHSGHELLIQRAAGECSSLCIISWSVPEFPGCDAPRRAAWLAELFPAARRIVLTQEILTTLDPPAELALLPPNNSEPGPHRRLCAWLCERLWQCQPEAVFTSEDYGPPFAEEMTRWFRRTAADHPGVTAVAVDPGRSLLPVSGTQIRADVHGCRHLLPPLVYRDFVQRVVLLGGESTGKSTLAAALAGRLGTVFVSEYGREFWEAKSGRLVLADMLSIAREQLAREAAAAAAADTWLICDTSPLTTLFYSLELFGKAESSLVDLARQRYYHTFLCAPDFPFVQDGTRQAEAFRMKQDAWFRRELEAREIPWTDATGSLEHRAASAVAVLLATHSPTFSAV